MTTFPQTLSTHPGGEASLERDIRTALEIEELRLRRRRTPAPVIQRELSALPHRLREAVLPDLVLNQV